MSKIGILHPGEMGISIAASARNNGHEVYWVSEGRSAATRGRAEKYGLQELQTLAEICTQCSILISVCPPDAAERIAYEVSTSGFTGLYVDANAIAPERALRMSQRVRETGAAFVDGGIIGGPAWEPNRTWLYLAGEQAEEVGALFALGPLMTQVLAGDIGTASALKMCYAAYSKGTTALLSAILAVAESMGVREDLAYQWERDEPQFAARTHQRVQRVTAKAWRFAGEMEEIATTFRAAGLPGAFHEGAAEVYQRLALYKDAPSLPPLEEILEVLLQPREEELA